VYIYSRTQLLYPCSPIYVFFLGTNHNCPNFQGVLIYKVIFHVKGYYDVSFYWGLHSKSYVTYISSSKGNDIDGKREYKMMCARGFASDVPNTIALDDQLEMASKQPPSNPEYVKSFTGNNWNDLWYC